MAGKWGQEARFDRWVKYRSKWVVHYAPPPKTGAEETGLTARSSPPNVDRGEGGREGGGGAAFAVTGRGRGGEAELN